MSNFIVYLGAGIIFFLIMLAWGAYLDECYFSDGLPGHRPLEKWWTNGDGIYRPGQPPLGLTEHKEP
jgi:hypothetical protein